jgi:mono/diheme cytochrome c family protein
MTTYALTLSEVIVTVHILAVVAAFGGAVAYPVWFRMIRGGTPEQRAFFHRAQAKLGKLWITPWIVVLFGTGAYLTTDQDLWDAWWVLIPTAILVVILALGIGLLGPSEERLTRYAEEGDQSEYEAVLRRVKAATWLAIVLVVAATLMMVARIPDSTETEPVHETAPRGAQVFVEAGCGSCHTLAAAGTRGTHGPNLDEAADLSAAEIRVAIGAHPDDFNQRLSEQELDALTNFIAEEAGSGN